MSGVSRIRNEKTGKQRMEIKSLGELKDQRGIALHLQNALDTGTLSHAYMIAGEDTADTMEIAGALAGVLVCEHPQDGKYPDGEFTVPCGECTGCIRAIQDDHPDITVLTPAKTSSIGIDDIRSLMSDIRLMPYSAGYRVFIIPEAGKLTAQAQNAVLKTLEDPPEYAVLILLCRNFDGFLPTLLSRCVKLQLVPVSARLIEESAAGSPYARLIAAYASGSMGKARKLMEEGEFEDFAREEMALLCSLPAQDTYHIAALAESVSGRDMTEPCLFIMHAFVRDILVLKASGSSENLILTENIQYISEMAKRLSFQAADRMEKDVMTAERRVFSKGNARLVLEAALIMLRSDMAEMTTGGEPV